MAELPNWAKRARSNWKYYGQKRPSFAIKPKKGEESVWDYPRPPKIEVDSRHVVIKIGDLVIAKTDNAIRILETASPPIFYLPPTDIHFDALVQVEGESRCEWKGVAKYWSVNTQNQTISQAAWSYPTPFEDYAAIKDHLSFYPAKVECYVNGERVRPQPGGFYGGWITNEIVGPVKGESSKTCL